MKDLRASRSSIEKDLLEWLMINKFIHVCTVSFCMAKEGGDRWCVAAACTHSQGPTVFNSAQVRVQWQCWELEIDHGGNIHTTEMGKSDKPQLSPSPLREFVYHGI